MEEDGGGQSSREVPSLALDRLFLELHDQLPKESRERFAQLADEVKRLTESSTTKAPVTPSSSADQAVVRREEEIATAEAKQRSGELQARGAVVTSLNDQPILKDVVCIAVPRVAARWYDLGLALDIQPFVLDGVAHQQEKADRPREMFAKWLETSPDTGSQPRTWQSVLDAVGTICGSAVMEGICTAVQKTRIPTPGDLEESKTTEPSSATEMSRKRRRSSTRSSDDLALQQSVVKKSLPDYTAMKIDLLAQDISDLHSESDPEVIIKLLYGNALATISDLLEPHLKAVKKAAGRYHRLGIHHVAVGEDIIESADSIDRLVSQMSVGGMWDQTRFLRKAIASIPHSAPERGIAEAVLSHYHLHLAIYERTTLLKDSLTKKSESEHEVEGSSEANKLVPLEITSSKAFDSFSCEDCHILQVRCLSAAYGIPKEKIIRHDVKENKSTSVTFLIPHQYIHDVIQHSSRLDAVWILLELDIIEVSIPGVFTFIPSVGCFMSLLRGSRPFTADLLGVTEVLPYQTYCLLDPDTKEPLSGRPISTKRIEQHWDSHGDLVPDPQCSVPESADLEILATHSEEAVIPPKGSEVGATDELQSKVGELEDKVKDLEQKVDDLFNDNMALKTKLEASREVERQQQEEITHLTERLVQGLSAQSEEAVLPQKDSDVGATDELQSKVGELEDKLEASREVEREQQEEINRLKERLMQALSAQDMAPQEQSLSRTRELQLERKIKVLEQARSDLEAEVEKYDKQMKQLEILPCDIEQLTESAVPGQVTGEPTAATRGSQPATQASGSPPVVEAARLGQLSAVRQLLDSGTATVEDEDEEGMTALLWASFGGHLPVVRELVNVYKTDLFQKNKDDHNAMHKAAEGGSLDVIKYLLPMFEARVYEKDAYSYTMLHWAAQRGHCQMARYLIETVNMDPQDRDKWGCTALLRAAEGGSALLVKALLEDYGSSVDEVNEEGLNAMHCAAQGGSLDVIKYLLPMFGARVHEKDMNSYTMLHWAAQGGHCQVARYLIQEVQLDPHDRDKWGTTVLLRAAYGGSVPLVRALLEEYGSTLDEVDEEGLNAMHKAAEGGSLDVINFLLPMLEARVHEKDTNSFTMLHWAARYGHFQVARYLIETLNMDPQDRDKWGCTVLLRAAKSGCVPLVRALLEDYGSLVDEMNEYGRTAVLLAAVGGHLDLMRELVEQHRADLLHKANDGANALHLAAANGHLDVVRYLLPRIGHHRFNKDNYGETCLDWAVAEGKHNVVEYLQQEGGFSG